MFLEAVKSFGGTLLSSAAMLPDAGQTVVHFFHFIAQVCERVKKGFGEMRNHAPGPLTFQGKPAFLYHPLGERIFWFGSGLALQVPLPSPRTFGRKPHPSGSGQNRPCIKKKLFLLFLW